MTIKRSGSALRTLLLSFTRVFSSAIDVAQNGNRILAAAAGVCALLLLGGSVPAYAQNVTFAGVQTTVPASGLSDPYGVAADKAGDVFIADSYNNRVVEVPAGGGPQITVGSGLTIPTGVAVDGAGDVFIADYGNDRVVEVPAGGGSQTTLLTYQNVYYPYGVAVDGAGDVFVADTSNNRVVEVAAGGGAQTTVGSGLSYPTGVAVDGAGDVFIADEVNSRVVEVPAGGGAQTTVGSGLSYPWGVAVDGAGDVFIADSNNSRVVEVPAGGGPQTTVSASGLSYFVPGVAVDGAGDVFILDTGNNRVVEVQRVAVNFGSFGSKVNVCPAGQTSPAPCSQTITLNYNVAATTIFGTTKVVTQGAPSLDFTLSSGSTCTGTVSAGSSCTVNVSFAPRAPGVRMGAVQLTDNSGNLLVTTLVHGIGQGPAIVFGPGPQTTVGSGLSTQFGVAVDGAGDIFIADDANTRVVEVPAGCTSSACQTTVGSGLDNPEGLALDGAGDVFVADTGNNRVVEVPAGGGPQTTVGNGLYLPYGVAVDKAGDVFIADTFNNRVVEVPAGGGPQTTVGSGLSHPYGVAVDGAGDVFIGDTYNDRVVEVPAGGGAQTTVNTGSYTLSYPFGVAVDGAGDVFIADFDNSRVVEVPAGGGAQSTVGSGLNHPTSVAVDGAGDVFIADQRNNRVVEVQRSQPPTLSFAPTLVGSRSSDSPQSVTIQNIGNQPLNAIDPGLIVVGPNFLQVAGSGTPADCTSSFSLAPGATCNLSISFEPQSAGNPLMSTAVFTDNAFNSPQSASLSGIGQGSDPGQPTGVTATAGNSQASITFTAPASNGGSAITGYTVSPSPGVNTFTGTTSPVVVTGLTNGTAYTFTVTATNSVGTGPPSAASNSVTPASVPGAPTIGTATAGNAQASITFTAPAWNGGSAITGYTVTSSPGGNTFTGTTSPVVVTGLTNGMTYTFTVTATNSVGTGPPSAATNSVTLATVPTQSVAFAGTQTTVPASGLNNPFGVAVDGAGDVFIADSSNGRVVEVPAGGGPQTTVGSGLSAPYGVTVDGAGDLFIADTYNSRVLELPYLGSGVYGPQVAVGSGLYYPTAVAVDRAGDVFIVNGGVSQQVVEVPAGGGPQTTVPLSGSDYYYGVAVDGTGDLFVAGQNNNRVLEIPAGRGPQTTVGSGLSNPTGLAVDGVGDVFIADTFNNRVVKIPAGGGPQTTVPASGLYNPYGVAVDGAGDVFIADSRNNRVVEVQRVAVNFGNVNVCPEEQTTPAPCSQTLTLNYSVATTTTFGTISVVTQGASDLDFRLSSGTCTGTTSAGSTCTVSVTFAPLAPGVRMGGVQLTDNSGNVLVTTMIHGIGQGPAITFGPGVQTTVPATGLANPYGIALDGAGDVFIADPSNTRVVKVPAGGGPQTTVGSGLINPVGLAVDGAGNVFVADTALTSVVEVPSSGGAQTTVGSGLTNPGGVAVDGAGDVFIADTFNNRVVEVPAGGGPQTTVGTGLYNPIGVAVDGAGNVFVTDRPAYNNRVVKIPAGGGPQTTLVNGLYNPTGISVDGAGDVFVADFDNDRVLELPAGGGPPTMISGSWFYPFDVKVDGAGNLFVMDWENSRVVELHRSQPPTFSFASTPVGSTSSDSPQSVTIQNVGNQPLNAIDPGLVVGGPNFLQVAGSGTPVDCKSSFSLSPGATCNLSISFEPQSIGKLTAGATFIDNALNAMASSQSVALQATATQGSQTIAFGTLSNQVFGTAPFTVSATVSSGLTVSFNSQTTGVCTVSGTTVTLVAVGTCTIQATQAGNTNYATAAPVNQSFQVTSSPGIYAPVNSSTLTGNSATFLWYGYPSASAYWLDVGSTQGGNNYYSSGSLSTSIFSLTVTTLPSGGSTVWARWYYLLSGTWQYVDYSYTGFGASASKGVITSPAPSSTLSGSSVTFNWTAGAGASAYWVDVGSTAGGNNYYSSGNLGNVLTAAVNGLPTNGGTVYVTLYSQLSGQWLSNAYTYTAFNLAGAGGVMSTPTPGSTLTGSSVRFNWTAGAGASAYWVDVGSTAGGNNYYSSGNLGTALTTSVNGLPTDGSTIYVTLYSLVGGVWMPKAYIYTALKGTVGLAVVQTPTPGSTLSGNAATFTWSSDASATAYWVDIGSTAGGNDVYSSGNLGLVQTTTVYTLPANGGTIYVTLYSLVGAQWLSTAATYVSGP